MGVCLSVCRSVGRSVCVSVYLDQLGICYADVFVEAAPETASLLGDVTPKPEPFVKTKPQTLASNRFHTKIELSSLFNSGTCLAVCCVQLFVMWSLVQEFCFKTRTCFSTPSPKHPQSLKIEIAYPKP